jgi:hypothetical protein
MPIAVLIGGIGPFWFGDRLVELIDRADMATLATTNRGMGIAYVRSPLEIKGRIATYRARRDANDSNDFFPSHRLIR